MIYQRNETHDPGARSWVESANAKNSQFPIQNLPFGVFRRDGGCCQIGIAIGDQVLDLAACGEADLLMDLDYATRMGCRSHSLNELMSLTPRHWSALRKRLFRILNVSADEKLRNRLESFLVPLSKIEMKVPAEIGDYTDFYAFIDHATHVGAMLRPENPLLPNYKWIPVGYHGRASSIVISGTTIRRPSGQTKTEQSAAPVFRASARLDYELEVGIFVGGGNPLGESISIDHAAGNIFGLCLVNDWSARDLQAWEYQPLGPFLAKNFATSISPWVVTLEALEPYRVPAFSRSSEDPAPLPYLHSEQDQLSGGIDLTLEVALSTEKMRLRKIPPCRLSSGSLRQMYWTIAQLLTHHTSSGCNLRPGDLLASGTVSGDSKHSRGCLLELTWKGTEPIQLPSGEQRRFLEAGDEVIMRGWCEGEGKSRIGFGQCTGRIAN